MSMNTWHLFDLYMIRSIFTPFNTEMFQIRIFYNRPRATSSQNSIMSHHRSNHKASSNELGGEVQGFPDSLVRCFARYLGAHMITLKLDDIDFSVKILSAR
jgi:hypothetical protein